MCMHACSSGLAVCCSWSTHILFASTHFLFLADSLPYPLRFYTLRFTSLGISSPTLYTSLHSVPVPFKHAAYMLHFLRAGRHRHKYSSYKPHTTAMKQHRYGDNRQHSPQHNLSWRQNHPLRNLHNIPHVNILTSSHPEVTVKRARNGIDACLYFSIEQNRMEICIYATPFAIDTSCLIVLCYLHHFTCMLHAMPCHAMPCHDAKSLHNDGKYLPCWPVGL